MRRLFLVCGLTFASLALGGACSKSATGEGGGRGGSASGGGGGGGSNKGGASGAGGVTGGTSGSSSGGAKSGGVGGTASGGSGGASTSNGGAKASGGAGGTTSGGGAGGITAAGGATATGGAKPTGGTSGGGAGGQTAAADCTAPLKGDVALSVPSGTFKDSVSVSLSTTLSGAEIRYTTDGKAPTSTSTLYSGTALKLTSTTRLRAQAFAQGTATGTGSGALYVARAIDATHDLPVIILDSFGSGKLSTVDGKRPFVDVAYLAVEPTTSGGTVSLSSAPTTASFAAFHVRGNSSAMFDKVPYRLELRDEAGQDRDCPTLGMPAESDWALVGPHADKTLIHNNFVYELGREMGMQAPRVKLAEVYVNVDTSPLATDDYQGVYQIVEIIKNQKDRLNLKQLNETKLDDAQISGGYIFKFEWAIAAENPLPCPAGTPDGWSYLELWDPLPIATKQQDWLINHLLAFNKAVHGSDISNTTSGYPNYIEPATFVDTVIINELTRNMDGLARSQWFFKDRDKKINAGPLWDFDLIAGVGLNPGSAMAGTLANTAAEGWQYEGNASRMTTTSPSKADAGVPADAGKKDAGSGFPPVTTQAGTTDWFPRLIGDPTFKSQLVARWKSLRGALLADAAMDSRIDGLAKNLSGAADRNFKRWNILAQAQVKPFDTPTDATWAGQVTSMKTWLKKRAAWLDGQWK